eukprot:1184053-Prorocentrum_minimum.AAC.1
MSPLFSVRPSCWMPDGLSLPSLYGSHPARATDGASCRKLLDTPNPKTMWSRTKSASVRTTDVPDSRAKSALPLHPTYCAPHALGEHYSRADSRIEGDVQDSDHASEGEVRSGDADQDGQRGHRTAAGGQEGIE